MTTAERGAARSTEAALAAWRAAERDRDDLPFGSAEWMKADRRVDELRRLYHEHFESAAKRDGGTSDHRSPSV